MLNSKTKVLHSKSNTGYNSSNSNISSSNININNNNNKCNKNRSKSTVSLNTTTMPTTKIHHFNVRQRILSRAESNNGHLSSKSALPIVEKTYTLDNLINEIQTGRIKKVVIMAGAGISTPSGIPDFRTPGTGLYHNLHQFKIPYPEAIFELDYFSMNPKPFFTLAKELMPCGKYRPNKIHYFIRLLQDKDLLYRCYTQNIDGLEHTAGVKADKLVEAHGSFKSAQCLHCRAHYSGSHVKKAIHNDEIPTCDKKLCRGIVKPDIVFFGESLPSRFNLYYKDFPTAHLIIVMGTSLKVKPFAGILGVASNETARLLINREAVGQFKSCSRLKDLRLLGDLVDSIDVIVEKLGWKNDLDELMKHELLKYGPIKTDVPQVVITQEAFEVQPVADSKPEVREETDVKPESKQELKKKKIYPLSAKSEPSHKFRFQHKPDVNAMESLSHQLSQNMKSSVPEFFGRFSYTQTQTQTTQSQSNLTSKTIMSAGVRESIIRGNDELLGLSRRFKAFSFDSQNDINRHAAIQDSLDMCIVSKPINDDSIDDDVYSNAFTDYSTVLTSRYLLFDPQVPIIDRPNLISKANKKYQNLQKYFSNTQTFLPSKYFANTRRADQQQQQQSHKRFNERTYKNED